MPQIQNIAFIGTRGHYATVLRELPAHPSQRVVAVADGGDGDTSAPVSSWARSQPAGDAPRDFGSDWLRLLDDAKPDAVVICGPFELQAAMACAAIDRGVHVMVEKPAALSFDDLEQLRAAHRRSPGVHLASMVFSRYFAGFYTAAHIVRSGAIGPVRLIESRKSYKLGTRGPYYRQRRTYGGSILWVGSHAIDWVAWMSGQQFKSVFASHSSAHNGPDLGSMERSALCHFKLTGEVVASVAIDVYRPECAPTHGDDWIRIVGTRGVIEARPDSAHLISPDHAGPRALGVACDRKPWADFVAHAEGRHEAITDASSALRLADACLRARESADTESLIRFEPVDMPDEHRVNGSARPTKPVLETLVGLAKSTRDQPSVAVTSR